MSFVFRHTLFCQGTNPLNIQSVLTSRSRFSRLGNHCTRSSLDNVTRTFSSISRQNTKPMSMGIKNSCALILQARNLSFNSLSRNVVLQLKNKVKPYFGCRSSGSFSLRIKQSKPRFDRHRKLRTDVIIYSHENDKFYLLFGYFGLFQMGIWIYLALAAQQFKSVPSELTDSTDIPWWKWMILKQGQFKNSFSALSIAVGLIVLFMAMTYPQRAVKRLWLLKDGEHVRIMTYSLFGKNRTIEAPLNNLNFNGTRTGAGSHIPIKVKDKTFFYTLDKQGLFHDNELFDFVIGLKRNLK